MENYHGKITFLLLMLPWKHRKFLSSALLGRADGFQKLLKIHELRSVGGQQGLLASHSSPATPCSMDKNIPTWKSLLPQNGNKNEQVKRMSLVMESKPWDCRKMGMWCWLKTSEGNKSPRSE